jgi:hypothetical protein
MLEATIRRLRRDNRAVSNIIVVMLSLVLITIIVGNVVLWSYQMNQVDLERMQEKVQLTNATRVTRSLWFTAQTEYQISAGSRLAGSFTDTNDPDGSYETFQEEMYRLSLSNTFQIDLSTYPINNVRGLELLVRCNVSEASEKWFMRMYNWSASGFSDAGFNITSGHQPALDTWNEYAVSITNDWLDYVDSSGTMMIEFFDEGLAANQTVVDIDFLGARAIVDGARFELKNSSPYTAQIVAIWVVNSTWHQRYGANLFVNSGEETIYIRIDIKLPEDNFIAKIVTEKGNASVFP